MIFKTIRATTPMSTAISHVESRVYVHMGNIPAGLTLVGCLIDPVFPRGLEMLKTAFATIMGFEVIPPLRIGQAAIFSLTQDIRGEARIVGRAFGAGACGDPRNHR
jgi:hypothetical protein